MRNFSRIYEGNLFVIIWIFQVRLQYCQVGCEVHNSRKLEADAVHPSYPTYRENITELLLDFQI